MNWRHTILAAAGSGAVVWLLWPKRIAFLVLGNSNKAHAQKRIDAANYLAKLMVPDMVVMSGKGDGIDGVSEAEWLAARYTGPGRVVVEAASMSTKANIELSATLIPRNHIVVVISDQEHVVSAAWCLRFVQGFKDVRWWWVGQSALPKRIVYQPIECERAGCCP